jgi:hypothetical protein
MKRIYKNWLVRTTVGFAALTSIRMVSTLLHITTLERLYRPRDFRRTSHPALSQKIIDELPKYCQTAYGLKMDPINLIFIGTEAGIEHAFETAQWQGADPSTPVHWAIGLLSSIFNRSYRRGPFMPLFVSVGLQDLAFQKTTHKNRFTKRHHIRIWRTRHVLPGDNRIWVAAATREVGIKIVWLPPFIVHKMDPDLDGERDYIADKLVDLGHEPAGEHHINNPITKDKPKRNPNNDFYYTDGKAKAIKVA